VPGEELEAALAHLGARLRSNANNGIA
jgi:hypothetical protein